METLWADIIRNAPDWTAAPDWHLQMIASSRPSAFHVAHAACGAATGGDAEVVDELTGTDYRLWRLEWGMAGVAGLEPVTSAVTGQRSNQLSYTPTRAE